MPQTKSKCCVLLSGGIDSTTACCWAAAEGKEVEAIHFAIGADLNSHEERAAIEIADTLGIRIHVIPWPFTQERLLSCQPMGGARNPAEHRENAMSVFVGLTGWLSVAAAYCVQSGIQSLVLGFTLHNTRDWIGIDSKFHARFSELVRAWSGVPFEIGAPFLADRKAKVIQTGMQLGAPFNLTWSCRSDGPRHCGRCDECVDRMMGFAEAALPDPAEYGALQAVTF